MTQSEFTPSAENQSAGAGKPFSLSRRQLILIVVGGLVLLFIFWFGVRAGEKRALRKQQLAPESQPPVLPTQTLISPNPTVYPSPVDISPSPAAGREGEKGGSNPTRCSKGTDCIICLFGHLGVPCNAGECINGICVWPTEQPHPIKNR